MSNKITVETQKSYVNPLKRFPKRRLSNKEFVEDIQIQISRGSILIEQDYNEDDMMTIQNCIDLAGCYIDRHENKTKGYEGYKTPNNLIILKNINNLQILSRESKHS